jgi:hypothetical protein
MSTNIVDLNSTKITAFELAEFSDDCVRFSFINKESFENWFVNVAKKHCFWVSKEKKQNKGAIVYGTDRLYLDVLVCDHAGNPKKRKITSEEVVERRGEYGSKKVGCPVRLSVDYLNNGQVLVKYIWKHQFHDPTNIEEMIESKLPDDVKQWIAEKVSLEMDWKSIKAVLRLSEDTLNEVQYTYHIFDLLYLLNCFTYVDKQFWYFTFKC